MTDVKRMGDSMGFQDWPETERLYQVRRKLNEMAPHKDWKSITGLWRPKIKLHGTNAGIRIEKDDMGFQGRQRNVGSLKYPKDEKFYNFQDEAKDFNADNVRASEYEINVLEKAEYKGDPRIWSIIAGGGSVTVYGEWAGKGIQNIVACSKVPKFFAPFAIRVNSAAGELLDTVVEPDSIHEIIGNQPDWVRVLPWADEAWEINMSNEGKYRKAHIRADALIKEVEKCDPFVKAEFGVEDIGEGAVFFPVHFTVVDSAGNKTEFAPDHKLIATAFFKVKGDKHQKKHRQRNPDNERALKIIEFLEQALDKKVLDDIWDGDKFKDPQDIPEWMKTAGPVVKDSVLAYLETDAGKESGFEWNDLKSKVGGFMSGYFQDKCGF